MSNVNHPAHYNDGKIEVIEFIEDKNLDFHLGNAVKYICRAGKKDPNKIIEDLEKAIWYIQRRMEVLKTLNQLNEEGSFNVGDYVVVTSWSFYPDIELPQLGILNLSDKKTYQIKLSYPPKKDSSSCWWFAGKQFRKATPEDLVTFIEDKKVLDAHNV